MPGTFIARSIQHCVRSSTFVKNIMLLAFKKIPHISLVSHLLVMLTRFENCVPAYFLCGETKNQKGYASKFRTGVYKNRGVRFGDEPIDRNLKCPTFTWTAPSIQYMDTLLGLHKNTFPWKFDPLYCFRLHLLREATGAGDVWRRSLLHGRRALRLWHRFHCIRLVRLGNRYIL